MVRVPQIKSISLAVKIYYTRIDLGNKDINELFGSKSSVTIKKLKDLAREQMQKDGKQSFNPLNVNTQSAFISWGLDIAELEKKHSKIKRWGLEDNEEQ